MNSSIYGIWDLISSWVIWTRKREKGKVMSIKLAFPEFGGGGDHISKDGLRDGVTRRLGDGENIEMRSAECGICREG